MVSGRIKINALNEATNILSLSQYFDILHGMAWKSAYLK
jgi:hypothetical protein